MLQCVLGAKIAHFNLQNYILRSHSSSSSSSVEAFGQQGWMNESATDEVTEGLQQVSISASQKPATSTMDSFGSLSSCCVRLGGEEAQ